jgi:hypothetical protein
MAKMFPALKYINLIRGRQRPQDWQYQCYG